jgi:ketosteroid isomerase-like protein
MQTTAPSEPLSCIQRLQQAINEHNLEELVACFAQDYVSVFPAHPERAFQGNEPVRANWSEIFRLVPDIQAELLGAVEEGDTIWAEWEWRGTHIDGQISIQRGVTIQRVSAGKMDCARLYIEPVRVGAPDVATTLEPVTS